ncbi:hypothetical protein J4H86_23585 [Spiractinospora alimapuensis]|uniref:hypothetical protein n=1 Tax=Spiractinospora alimapuensis TaxID=2820884 RepID=UPI001F4483E7|nr:hypothetical protein [Spiractinospora alimapuensis]QVQ51718.1 hypothetical protein J4H86_23585 [Spiractinospora alimapuensis]
MQSRIVIAGWVAAAIVAVAAGITAVLLVQGGSLTGPGEPMSDAEVAAELQRAENNGDGGDEAKDDPSAPESEEPPEELPSGQLPEVPDDADAQEDDGSALFSEDGGTVLARCTDGRAELVWWVAAQGFWVEDVDPGPDDDAEVEFEGGGQEVEYTITCADGQPRLQVEYDD